MLIVCEDIVSANKPKTSKYRHLSQKFKAPKAMVLFGA